MPRGIECITADVREFAFPRDRLFSAIGIDVGGPSFSYDRVLTAAMIARARRVLRDDGRIAVNISLEAPKDAAAGRIADRLAAEGLEVWAFTEKPEASELNVVLLASPCQECPSTLAAIAGDDLALAKLAAHRRRSRQRAKATARQ
jgi:hypothetical protein